MDFENRRVADVVRVIRVLPVFISGLITRLFVVRQRAWRKAGQTRLQGKDPFNGFRHEQRPLCAVVPRSERA